MIFKELTRCIYVERTRSTIVLGFISAIIIVDPAGAKKIKSLRVTALASSYTPTVGVFTFKLSAAQMAGGKITRIALGTPAGQIYKVGSLTLTWKKGW